MNKTFKSLLLKSIVLVLGGALYGLPIDVASGYFGVSYADSFGQMLAGFPWTAIKNPDNKVVLCFVASAVSDLHIGLQTPPYGERGNWIEFVVGGWGNNHSAVRTVTGSVGATDPKIISHFDLLLTHQAGAVVSNAMSPGQVPEAANFPSITIAAPGISQILMQNVPLFYMLTVAPEEGTGNGVATLVVTDGTATTTVFSCKAPFLNKVFSHYSFRSYQWASRPIALYTSAVLSPREWGAGWLKRAGEDVSLTIDSAGLLKAQNGKDQIAPFSIFADESGRKVAIFSRSLNKCVVAGDYQGSGVATSDKTRISGVNSTGIDFSNDLMWFALDGTATASFKLKTTATVALGNGVMHNPYLAVDGDNYVRAFRKGLSESLFNSANEAVHATFFTFESVPPPAPFDVGSVATFQFADGSFWAVDPVSNSLVAKQTCLLDPYIHFKIDSYQKETGSLGLGWGSTSVATDDSKNPSQLKLEANNYAGFTGVYDSAGKKFSLGYRGGKVQQNPANLSGPLVLAGVGGNSSYLLTVGTSLTTTHKLLDGLSPLSSLTSTSVLDDLVNRFKPAFALPSKTAAEWKCLVNVLAAYASAASSTSLWTTPSAATGSAQSRRDIAVGLFQSAINDATTSADAKTFAQSMVTTLADMPVFLADPTTPPAALNVNVGDVLALNLGANIFVMRDASGKITAGQSSVFNPATNFTVKDYNKATGRICLGFDSSYVRLSADATSFVSTGTKCFIDIVRDASNANKVSFAYAGSVISFAPTKLGLNGTGSVKDFVVVPVPPSFVNATNLALVDATALLTKDTALAGLKTLEKAFDDLLSATNASGSLVSQQDWFFWASLLVGYAQRVTVVPEWMSVQMALSATATREAIATTLAGYLQIILQKVTTLTSPVAIAVKVYLDAFAQVLVPMKTGSVVTFALADGSYLAIDRVSRRVVPVQTSQLDPATHFTVQSYSPDSGVCTLAFGDQFVASDDPGTPTKLILKNKDMAAVFNSAYDVGTKKFSFGFRGGNVQVDPANPAGPVIVTGVSGLDPSKYTFTVSKALTTTVRVLESLSTSTVFTPLSVLADVRAFGTAYALPQKSTPDWKYLVSKLTSLGDAASSFSWWTTPSVATDSPLSLRDRTVSLLQLAVTDTTVTADIKNAAKASIATFNDIPVYVADPAMPPPALNVNVGDAIALNIGDSKFVVVGSDGSVTGRDVSSLDPAARFVVKDYNKATGRICLASNTSYLRLSPDATSFVLTGTKRFVDIVRDASNANKFSFAYAGKTVALNASSLGVAGTMPVQNFTVVPVSAAVAGLSDQLQSYISNVFTKELLSGGLKAIESTYKSLIAKNLSSPVGADDWKFVTLTAAGYVQRAIDTSALSLWTAPSASEGALRDAAVALFQALIKVPIIPATDKDQFKWLVEQLVDMPIALPDPATPPASLALAGNDVIALKVAEDMYVSMIAPGVVKASSTHLLDPKVHFVVRDYNKTAGRICLGFNDLYVRLSSDGTSFITTGTKRFIDVVRDATDPKKISFAYSGKSVEFSAQALGITTAGASGIKTFELAGPLTAAQKILDGLNIVTAEQLTASMIQADIQNRFDPLFMSLGTTPGDWAFFVKSFIAYLARAAQDVATSASLDITASQAGTLTLKDYSIGVLSSICSQFSTAPSEVQQVARAAVVKLRGGQPVGDSGSGAATLADNSRVILRIPTQDLSSTSALVVSANGSVQVMAGKAQCIPAAHITVAKYDALAKTIKLAFAGKFFDKTTKAFSASSLETASSLTMEQVRIGSVMYYYLNDGSPSKRLGVSAAQAEVLSFGAVGTIFDIVVALPADCALDAIADPATPQDIEQALVAYSKAFELSASDGAALAVLSQLCGSYCQQAMTHAAWERGVAGSQLAGAAPRDYARAMLTALVTSSAYPGVSQTLRGSILQILKSAAFSAEQVAAVSQASAGPAYLKLDAAKGMFSLDLPVFDEALREGHASARDLTVTLSAMSSYIAIAATQVAWAASPEDGSQSPRDYACAVLQRMLDNDWYFTGLTSDLKDRVSVLIRAASNENASYPAQIAQLDSYLSQLTDVSSLTSSCQLMSALKALVPLVAKNGTAEHRASLLAKIDSYFDKVTIPALKGRVTDEQKNAWALVVFDVEVSVLQFDATTLTLLDEKIQTLWSVFKRRLGLIDQAVQTDALALLLDPYLKKMAAEFAILIKASLSSTDERSTNVQKILNYIDGLIKQLYVAQQDLALSQDSLRNLSDIMKLIWVATGMKLASYAAGVASSSVSGLLISPVSADLGTGGTLGLEESVSSKSQKPDSSAFVGSYAI